MGLKKMFLDFVEESEKLWESYKRGAMAPISFLLPMAIMAAASAAKKFAVGKGQIKGAKETKRVADVNDTAVFNERSADFDNKEAARLASVQGIADQLGGSNRALNPAVLQAMLQRRKSTVQKRETPDGSKGMGWGIAGDLAGEVANAAGSYMAGSNPNAVSGATSTLKKAGGVACPPDLAAQGYC